MGEIVTIVSGNVAQCKKRAEDQTAYPEQNSQKNQRRYTNSQCAHRLSPYAGDWECRIYNTSGAEKYSGSFSKSVPLLIPQNSMRRYMIVTPDSIETIELK